MSVRKSNWGNLSDFWIEPIQERKVNLCRKRYTTSENCKKKKREQKKKKKIAKERKEICRQINWYLVPSSGVWIKLMLKERGSVDGVILFVKLKVGIEDMCT